MSFLDLTDKKFLVVGVANRKSVAWSVAKLLQSEGAEVLFCVRSEKRKKELKNLLSSERHIFTCDFEKPDEIENLAQEFSSTLVGIWANNNVVLITFKNMQFLLL